VRREEEEQGAASAHASEARGAPDDSAARQDDSLTRQDESPSLQDDPPNEEDDSPPGGFNLFRQPWLVVACLLLAASVTLLLLSHDDAAFVCAALGVSAWFWNVREGLRRKHNLVRLSGRNWVQRGDEEEDED
jgi:hypothetical protein